MGLEELTERERKVFLSIVRSFIQTAEPVGSRYLAKNYDLQISPATVRNVMNDLEEKGLVKQPHTSAGRVPTDIGYRQYVDSAMEQFTIDDYEKQKIIEQMSKFSEDLDIISEKASQVLGEISSQLGIVLAPRFSQGKIEKIELVFLTEKKFLLVLGVQLGLVKTIIVEIEQCIAPNILQATNEVLNERLYGLSIDELQSFMEKRFRDVDAKIKIFIKAIQEKTDRIFQPKTDFYFAGTKNVISHPEFETREKMSKILELIDRKDILIRVINEHQGTPGVSIVIGEENKEDLMKNCSLITTSYEIQGAAGTLGVIGPTRMQYAKVISLVEFMSETLSYLFKK